MKLLAITPPAFAPLERLNSIPGVELFSTDDVEVLRDRANTAEAILLAPRYGSLLTELWPELENTQWIHSLGAGVETLPFDLLRESEIVVTNSRGLYADALGEFAIAAMLWFTKDFRRLLRNQSARHWEPWTIERLDGKSVAIVGYGAIGKAVGRRAEALGMHVLPVRRRRESGDLTLDAVLVDADFVVLSTPLTPHTRGLMTRERLQSMQKTAVLINIGRGAVVDQNALTEILAARQIRGAALDVFDTEPLPAGDPVRSTPNLIATPHIGYVTREAYAIFYADFVEAIEAFRAGNPIRVIEPK
ncbi:MAG TPA: D-2-hydroxyacid dehydrogenase [Thermoanaerobaculia bacterium]